MAAKEFEFSYHIIYRLYKGIQGYKGFRVKELELSGHNGDIYIYIYTYLDIGKSGFPNTVAENKFLNSNPVYG